MTVGSQVKQTLASLKGTQATLRIYSEQSQHEQTRVAFHEAVETVDHILGELEDRLRTLEFSEPQYKGN
jgi:hypothetical protein